MVGGWRCGWGTGMGSCIRGKNGWGRGRKDGGRVALRLGEGVGSRIREDNGWGRGRKDGGRVALREGRLLNTMALNIPKFRSFEVIRRWLL